MFRQASRLLTHSLLMGIALVDMLGMTPPRAPIRARVAERARQEWRSAEQPVPAAHQATRYVAHRSATTHTPGRCFTNRLVRVVPGSTGR